MIEEIHKAVKWNEKVLNALSHLINWTTKATIILFIIFGIFWIIWLMI